MIPPSLVRQQRVLGVAVAEPVEVVREQRLEQLVRRRAFDVELAHVRDVEDAAVLAHGAVLRDHALVLHRHLPAGERHHARAGREVALVERRPQKRLHARVTLTARRKHDAPASRGVGPGLLGRAEAAAKRACARSFRHAPRCFETSVLAQEGRDLELGRPWGGRALAPGAAPRGCADRRLGPPAALTRCRSRWRSPSRAPRRRATRRSRRRRSRSRSSRPRSSRPRPPRSPRTGRDRSRR